MKQAGFYFGLEQEYFLASNLDDDETEETIYVVPPKSLNLPRDNAGYLVEIRGRPYNCPICAWHSLEAERYRVSLILKHEYFLVPQDRVMLPIQVEKEALKLYGLPPKTKKVNNLYDHKLSNENLAHAYAGIHVTMSRLAWINSSVLTPVMFDIIPIIKWLDNYFKAEISKSKRLPGSYSVKNVQGGIGFEYRSLPTSIDGHTLMKALLKMKEELDL